MNLEEKHLKSYISKYLLYGFLALVIAGVVSTSGCCQQHISATRISYQEKPDGFPSMFQLGDRTLWIIFKSKPPEGTNLYLVESEDNGKTWSTNNPLRITDSKANAEHTSIAQLGGLIVVAWDNGNEVRCCISADSGETWKREEFEFRKAWYPYVYKVGEKIWYLFVSTENGLGGVIKYITYDGENWSQEKELLRNPDQSGSSSIFGNPVVYEFRGESRSELWLLWDTGAEAEPVSDIWWMRSLDNGVTWTQPEVLTKNTGELDDVDPCICEYDGKPLLVYASRPNDDVSIDYKIYYKIYENGGWSESVKLGEPYNYSQEHVLDWYPFCFTDNNGELWLVWASNRLSAGKSNKRMDVTEDNREIFVAPLEI